MNYSTMTNRTIKFRAWDKNKKEMLTFSGPWYCDEYNSLCFEVEQESRKKCLGALDMEESSEESSGAEIMQFTGLTDKNGKEIYEGDLLLTDDMYHDYEDGVAINALPDGKIYPVESRDGAFFAGDELLYEVATTREIIGNLYENSDLLK